MCFIFERARAPRHFLLGKGHHMIKLWISTWAILGHWSGGMEAIAFVASVKYQTWHDISLMSMRILFISSILKTVTSYLFTFAFKLFRGSHQLDKVSVTRTYYFDIQSPLLFDCFANAWCVFWSNSNTAWCLEKFGGHCAYLPRPSPSLFHPSITIMTNIGPRLSLKFQTNAHQLWSPVPLHCALDLCWYLQLHYLVQKTEIL